MEAVKETTTKIIAKYKTVVFLLIEGQEATRYASDAVGACSITFNMNHSLPSPDREKVCYTRATIEGNAEQVVLMGESDLIEDAARNWEIPVWRI